MQVDRETMLAAAKAAGYEAEAGGVYAYDDFDMELFAAIIAKRTAGAQARAIAKNKELAETAMRFADRAGDVHPGIDDAETICAEFAAAMGAVLDKWLEAPRARGTTKEKQ